MSDESRRYPKRPIVGVGAVIVMPADGPAAERGVVLIKRRFPPLAGRWSVPGGGVEAGETLTGGLAREIREETGLEIEVGPVLDVFDRITRDADGRVEYHYVLVDYLCRPTGGTLQAGSDVSDARVVRESDLGEYDLTEKTLDVIEKALTTRQG
jgi:ADP-ribose pyrophosphatase YjhB (NUDIX family)